MTISVKILAWYWFLREEVKSAMACLEGVKGTRDGICDLGGGFAGGDLLRSALGLGELALLGVGDGMLSFEGFWAS